ncbi:MAG: glutathione S-transferase [Alphaproteobacteria bacterium]|nr:glutathione S-transferase [Alphaproteobacteria bacterium]
MIDLYTAGTGNGRRASVMLEECGVPYTVHKLDLTKGEQKTPEYLKINPLGAIPAIVDHDGPGGQKITLSQSGAIALYLCEKTGKFLPKDMAKRAVAMQWLLHAMSDEAPTSGALFRLGSLPEKPAAAIASFETRLIDMFRHVDKRLGEAEYLAGELSVADFALYPVVAGRMALLDNAGKLDNLKRWAGALAARPGVSKGMKVPA